MKKIKKLWVLSAIVVMSVTAMGLSGCTKDVMVDVSTEAPVGEQVNVTTMGSSDTMIETGDKLYFKYENSLWMMKKSDDQLEKLYTFKEDENNATFWIYNNNLYFDAASRDNLMQNQGGSLYKMDLETKKVALLAELSQTPTALYASGGVLYAKGYGMLLIYPLNEDGSINEAAPEMETVYNKIPEGCEELYTGILPYLTEQNEYMPLTNGENLVIADKDGQNPRSVPEVTNTSSILFAKDAFYNVVQDGEGLYTCRRFALDTLSSSVVFETKIFPTLMQYKDGFLYYMESGSYNAAGSDSLFYQVDIENNKSTLAATMSVEPGTAGFYSHSGNFYVTEEAVYCQKLKDYSVYLEKTKLSDRNEKMMAETPLFESRIKGLGTVQAESKDIFCPDGEIAIASVYVETFVFDGDSEAVKSMNQILAEDSKSQLLYGENMMNAEDEAWFHEESFRTNTITYQISEVRYLDDQYVDLSVTGYEYTGGAHGMPYRTDYLFDRQTGKRLELSDVIGIPEEELKTVVSRYFRELSEKTKFSFDDPGTLETIVAERITMGSPFYITDEGVVFYFTPYDIAPYSEGFPEVIIPFEELGMKIPLGKI